MKWNKGIYIDSCLPFGLRSAPKLFNILADLYLWILHQQAASLTIHYLDDYLTMGPAGQPNCYNNLHTMIDIAKYLGIPLAMDKVEGPSHCLTFLGIILDTQKMQSRLPDDKLSPIKQHLSNWLHHKKATKREILSLVGLFQHASKVVKPGRIFVTRMYSTAAKIKKMRHFARLNKSFCSDLHWWHVFINSWNGVSFLHSANLTFKNHIFTYASGSWGFGAVFSNRWLQLPWSPEWATINIIAKEMVPIVVSCAAWGPVLLHKTVEFYCDNKGSSSDKTVMHLIRCYGSSLQSLTFTLPQPI